MSWIMIVVLGLAAVTVVSCIMDFFDMRKVTYYGGLRIWVNWRAKKYARDYHNAQQDRNFKKKYGANSGNAEYNRGLTLTLLLAILMVAPTTFAIILLVAGAMYLLSALGIVGGIWLALTFLPWYVWVGIIAVVIFGAWATNHLLMPVLVSLFRWLDRKLPPMEGICYAYQTKPMLPMSTQMGPADRQNWGGKSDTEAVAE